METLQIRPACVLQERGKGKTKVTRNRSGWYGTRTAGLGSVAAC